MPASPVAGKPNAGKATGNTPIYKKKWFIIVAVILGLALIGSIISAIGGGDSSNDAGETVESEETTDDTSEDTAEEELEEEDLAIESISATYSGSTEAGTVLDEDNEGIEVEATYEDGSTEVTYDWSISDPQTLKKGKKSTVTIEVGDKMCDLTVKCTTLSAGSYKKKCKKIAYNKLARNPDKYEGKKIKIYGQVIQVMDNGNSVDLRVGTKNSGYGSYYDDVVYVSYTYKSGESKILEDDMIKVFGEYGGTYTYESTGSGNITIPMMYGQYVLIK